MVSGSLTSLARKTPLRVVGLMSGTSADGIDAALVEFARRGRVEVLGFRTYPYPAAMRRRVLALCEAGRADVDEICHLNFALGELLAEAVVRLCGDLGRPLDSVDLVGSHGQTIRHLPQPRRFGRRRIRSTLQIGEPCVIAERTGVTTVADFRPRDLAAGGQGAPLVPFADCVLLTHPRRRRAVQNIGGIANVTYLPAGGTVDQVLAFDTGPGNMVMDHLVRRITGGKRHYDAGGRLAAKGTILPELLRHLMRHPYLRLRPPKSTGREMFGQRFTDSLLRRAARSRPEDLLATATAFTAASIADAYRRFLPGGVDEVVLCGGGARNRALTRMLAERLAPARVFPIDDLGISADAKEAVSFAVLARETLRGAPANVPAATGARHPVILGKIIPGGGIRN